LISVVFGEVTQAIAIATVLAINTALGFSTELKAVRSVDTPKRKYYKKLEMSVKVNPKTAKSKYINGVLEVTIKKAEKEEEPEGEAIKIE
jgi:HSP20 family molecular chaperone IbpA